MQEGMRSVIALCRFDRTHQLSRRMIGEAPHLLDPEKLDSISSEDGKQRGLYHVSTSQARSDQSTADFMDSVFQVLLPSSLHFFMGSFESGHFTAALSPIDLLDLAERACA